LPPVLSSRPFSSDATVAQSPCVVYRTALRRTIVRRGSLG